MDMSEGPRCEGDCGSVVLDSGHCDGCGRLLGPARQPEQEGWPVFFVVAGRHCLDGIVGPFRLASDEGAYPGRGKDEAGVERVVQRYIPEPPHPSNPNQVTEEEVEAAAEAIWNEREYRYPSGEVPDDWYPPGDNPDEQPPREPVLWAPLAAAGKYPASLDKTRAEARTALQAAHRVSQPSGVAAAELERYRDVFGGLCWGCAGSGDVSGALSDPDSGGITVCPECRGSGVKPDADQPPKGGLEEGNDA